MESKIYRVQVGAFKSKENAMAKVKTLKDAGFGSIIIEADGLYKVQVGSFSIKENADKKLSALIKAGFKDAFISVYIVKLKGEPTKPKEIPGYQKVVGELEKYLDKKSARKDIINNFNEYAKHVGKIRLRTNENSLCSETVISAFWKAGLIDLIGKGCTGCSSLKSNAKKLGIWHSGSSGIKAGDIVLYGKETPNHTEFAIDRTYNISGQYKDGGVHKRKRYGRSIHGYIRPKYS